MERTAARRTFRQWWSDLFWSVASPSASLPGKPNEPLILVEIIPCPIGDTDGPFFELSFLRELVKNALPDESEEGWVADVKILSAGLPLYIPTQNKLFICGRLAKPLPALQILKRPLTSRPNGRPNAPGDEKEGRPGTRCQGSGRAPHAARRAGKRG